MYLTYLQQLQAGCPPNEYHNMIIIIIIIIIIMYLTYLQENFKPVDDMISQFSSDVAFLVRFFRSFWTRTSVVLVLTPELTQILSLV